MKIPQQQKAIPQAGNCIPQVKMREKQKFKKKQKIDRLKSLKYSDAKTGVKTNREEKEE